MVGGFKTARVILFDYHNVCFFYIIIVVHLYYKRAWQSSWQRHKGKEHWDLGSIPRSPIYFFIFFLKRSNAAPLKCSIMHAQQQLAMCLSASIQWPRDGVHGVFQSTNMHVIMKSQTWLGLQWARIASKNLHFGPSHPLWFAFFNFILFSFKILLIVLIIITNSQ